MEDQVNKTKNENPKNKRRSIAVAVAVVFVAAVVLVTVLTLHNSNNNQKNAAKTAVVRITSTGFQPATLSVDKGTKVTWLSADPGLHEVVANPYPKGTDLPNLKSQILNQSQSYTFTADTAGSFGYHDQINPTINGTLLVKQ